MSISFIPLRQNSDRFDLVRLPDNSDFNLSNANALNLLDALGIEEASSSHPWPIQCFRTLVTLARRKRLGYQSPEIPVTGHNAPGHCAIIDCGRPEGYIERRLEKLSNHLNRSVEAGATHLHWG